VLQEDLREWYNRFPLDAKDKRLLADLVEKHQFVAFDCGECGERVRAAYPDDWGNFQGVCQDEYLGQLCADCYSIYERLKNLAED
jgi:hypothetical protein